MVDKTLEGDFYIIKVADFGLAKLLTKSSLAHTLVGTPQYWAPEGKATGGKSEEKKKRRERKTRRREEEAANDEEKEKEEEGKSLAVMIYMDKDVGIDNIGMVMRNGCSSS